MNEHNYSDMTETELYIEIGKAVVIEEVGFLPQNVKGLEERGRRWVKVGMTEFQSAICSSDKVRKVADQGLTSDLITAVSGAIEASVTGSAVTPVAILLCRAGIHSLCKNNWENSERNGK